MRAAQELALGHHGPIVTYSRKVFIPLTRLCRDVCHYCTFATTPRLAGKAYLDADEVLAIARAGVAAGCREALFTLGDQPEARHPAAREALDQMGYANTLAYLRAMAELVLVETGLLPHLNPGIMADADYEMLRPTAVAMGLMLETSSARLSMRGRPAFRLARQGSRCAPCRDRGGGPRRCAIHHRHPHRHRRDAGRAR